MISPGLVSEEPTGHSGKQRGQHKRLNLRPGNVDAHRLRRDFVFAHREHRATNARLLNPKGRHDGDRQKDADPEQICVFRDAVEADRAADRRREPIVEGRRVHGLGVVEHFVGLLQHDAENLAEAERDDRQIVAAQPQRRQADDITCRRRDQAAHDAGKHKQPIADAQKAAVPSRRCPTTSASRSR